MRALFGVKVQGDRDLTQHRAQGTTCQATLPQTSLQTPRAPVTVPAEGVGGAGAGQTLGHGGCCVASAMRVGFAGPS